MVEFNYKNIFDCLGDPVLICSLNYGKTLGNFYNANSATVSLLGYTAKELTNLNLLTISAANFEKELTAILDDLTAKGQIYFDYQFRKKNGEILTGELNAVLFNCDNRLSVLITVRNSRSRILVEQKLKQTTEQLRNLALHLQSVREEERKTIARDIHDNLGQVLTVLKIQVSLLSKKLREDQQELKNKIISLASLIDETVESVHRISSTLRPDILDELGLAAAIEWQSQDFQKNTGILCECDLIKDDFHLERDTSTAVFRIFQEAITNTARHSNGKRLKIKLSETLNGLMLEVTDNGKGITLNQINNPKSLGILGMKERALLFGGKVIVKSSMGSGTTVLVEIPVQQTEGVRDD